MARIVMCDRCKTFGDAAALGAVLVQTTMPQGREPAQENIGREICPICVGEIVALIETRPERDRGVPFEEPWQRPTADTVASPPAIER